MKIIFLTWVCPVCTWWLLPILLGAWLLGWFLGGIDKKKLKQRVAELEQDVFKITDKNVSLEKVNSTITNALDESDAKYHGLVENNEITVAKLNACIAKNDKLALEMKSFTTNKIEEVEVLETVPKYEEPLHQEITVSEVLPDDDASDDVDMIIGERDLSNVPFLKDDLKIIEGIGPKIERILKAAKIDTWEKLSDSTVDRLKQVLKTAGPRFQIHKPDSWPIQARYAEAGAWDKLVAYQKKLNLGKVLEEKSKSTSSKLGRMFDV